MSQYPLPPMLPGTKMKVKYHDNGDVTYTCVPEDSFSYGVKRFFNRLFWLTTLLLFSAFCWAGYRIYQGKPAIPPYLYNVQSKPTSLNSLPKPH
jgi:hypothetical protein